MAYVGLLGDISQSGSVLNEAFLKLFLAQLKNQNPLEPLNASEFTGQLAQLSQLEQLLSLKSGLEALKEAFDSHALLWAVGLMGKEVLVNSEGFYFDGETPVEFVLDLPSGIQKVGMVVYDSSSNPVAVQELTVSGGGRISLSWDGTGQDGRKVPSGVYFLKVASFDVKGYGTEARAYLKGKVTGLERSYGVTYLLLDGVRVPVSGLIAVLSR